MRENLSEAGAPILALISDYLVLSETISSTTNGDEDEVTKRPGAFTVKRAVTGTPTGSDCR